LFFSPWRWPHEWPKHVAGYFVINLHSYTRVHLFVVLENCCIHLVNARDMWQTEHNGCYRLCVIPTVPDDFWFFYLPVCYLRHKP